MNKKIILITMLAVLTWIGGGVLYKIRHQPVNTSVSVNSPVNTPVPPKPLAYSPNPVPAAMAPPSFLRKKPSHPTPEKTGLQITRTPELAGLETDVKAVLKTRLVPDHRLDFMFSGPCPAPACSDPVDNHFACVMAFDVRVYDTSAHQPEEICRLQGLANGNAGGSEYAARDFAYLNLVEKMAQLLGPVIYPGQERNARAGLSELSGSMAAWWQAADNLESIISKEKSP